MKKEQYQLPTKNLIPKKVNRNIKNRYHAVVFSIYKVKKTCESVYLNIVSV